MADLAPRNLNLFQGYWPLKCPNEIQAYILDFTEREDIVNFKLVSKDTYYFVLHKHEKLSRRRRLLKTLKSYHDLEPIQKLKIEFMKFNDRPIHHRIGIGIGCIILSPVIMLYITPGIIKIIYKKIVKPILKFIWKLIKKFFKGVGLTIEWIYNNILVPIGNAIKKISKWIWNKIVVPIANAIGKSCKWVWNNILIPITNAIIKTCKWIWNSILVPIGNGIKYVCMWINKNIIRRGIRVGKGMGNWILENIIKRGIRVCKAICNWIYDYILAPIGRGVKWFYNEAIVPAFKYIKRQIILFYNEFIYPYILVPIGKTIKFIFKAIRFILKVIFYWILWKFIIVNIYKAIKWTFNKVLIPVGKWIYVVLNGICVEFALKKIVIPVCKATYYGIIKPVGNAIHVGASFVGNNIIVPIAQFIKICANTVYSLCIRPIGLLIQSIGNIFRSK